MTPPASVPAADTVAVFGAGTMGEALVGGWLAAGRPAGSVLVVEKDARRRDEVAARHGVAAVEPAEAARRAGTLVLAVKPADVGGLLRGLAGAVRADTLVVSIAAGVPTESIEAALGDRVPVVRAMPNTPALVGAGMTVLAPGRHAAAEHLARAEALLGAVGRTAQLPEPYLDAVTAIVGSGPAYFFLLAEAMVDAAVLLGLTRPVAQQLVTQTLLGSATMLAQGEQTPAGLRDAVTSPGGTTIAAIRELERGGLRAAVFAAAQAARDRSAELAQG